MEQELSAESVVQKMSMRIGEAIATICMLETRIEELQAEIKRMKGAGNGDGKS